MQYQTKTFFVLEQSEMVKACYLLKRMEFSDEISVENVMWLMLVWLQVNTGNDCLFALVFSTDCFYPCLM